MEQWKIVKGYEDILEVSDKGSLRNIITGKVYAGSTTSRGYKNIDMRHYGGAANNPVHQLVMNAFSPKGWFEGAEIDHVDGNKSNNDLANLEWVTHTENLRRWAVKNGEPVVAVSPEGIEEEFDIQADICRKHSHLDFRHVSSCLKGKLKHHKGWKFRYKGHKFKEPSVVKRGAAAYRAVDPEGMVYQFTDRKAFAKEHGLSEQMIYLTLKGKYTQHKGWKFSDFVPAKQYKAVSPAGVEHPFDNQQKFADEHGLQRKQINACINGRQQSHKGWIFTG
jgi:hypothetical protein